ncbi:UDP-glucose 6-dehydrogenase [Bacillus sp. FJAT-27264]|uniref:UDP-glucose dehydrogenase family protein n=1 Tax=Paenibacillus sp. (strain DSM 101736 / FJAT-27264) TaxID=1850362 RepID=UPI00080808CF|nr:nucleotide sugar dehydrogenase [Bacillus sp. FJAT-27264]OBZ07883.1 UDP-glucose 6-dehydrogenase [Bacillus sp. FJAT-27264]
MNYTVTVIGLGFVGVTTALALAEKGNQVFGFDINEDRVNFLRSGRLPFIEPGLDKALVRHLNRGFNITGDPIAAILESDYIFLCVGTPGKEDGEADLSYIYSALDLLTAVDDGKYRVIVLKSTIPPSTTKEKVLPYLKEKGVKLGTHFGLANNPEFLREGKCWEDMMYADRIVCGVSDVKSEEALRSLYSDFETPFFSVSLNTGEFIKYLSNTLLATMISYSNEMAKAADAIGDIQIKEAFKILHKDRRWGDATMSSYVYPGSGYGGYCLPKDIEAMVAKAQSKGYDPKLLKEVVSVNDSMPRYMVGKVISTVRDKTKKIGILGLSFKPESDDVRDSTSAKIIKLLISEGFDNIIAYDPVANQSFAEHYNMNIEYASSKEEIYLASDILVLVTAWKEFGDVINYIDREKLIDCRYFI